MTLGDCRNRNSHIFWYTRSYGPLKWRYWCRCLCVGMVTLPLSNAWDLIWCGHRLPGKDCRYRYLRIEWSLCSSMNNCWDRSLLPAILNGVDTSDTLLLKWFHWTFGTSASVNAFYENEAVVGANSDTCVLIWCRWKYCVQHTHKNNSCTFTGFHSSSSAVISISKYLKVLSKSSLSCTSYSTISTKMWNHSVNKKVPPSSFE